MIRTPVVSLKKAEVKLNPLFFCFLTMFGPGLGILPGFCFAQEISLSQPQPMSILLADHVLLFPLISFPVR